MRKPWEKCPKARNLFSENEIDGEKKEKAGKIERKKERKREREKEERNKEIS